MLLFFNFFQTSLNHGVSRFFNSLDNVGVSVGGVV